jgi:polysaccharide biosynthesis PFTS motif protein
MISKYIKRKLRNRLLMSLRGHRHLKEQNAISKINILKQDLASTPCVNRGKYSKLIFGCEQEIAEIVVRQYLLARLDSKHFSQSILCSIGSNGSPVFYPLPKEWRKVVVRHGFKISNLISSLIWYSFILTRSIYFIFSVGRRVFINFINVIKSKDKVLCNYVYFHDLSVRNFPMTSSDRQVRNIFSWYMQWSDKSDRAQIMCHDVKGMNFCEIEGFKVVRQPFVEPRLTKFIEIGKLISWFSFTFILIVIDLLRKRWWHALLFGEAYKAKVFSIASVDSLAIDYLFHNSGWIYRPMWSYVAERRGSRVLFYFYSTNIEGFKQKNGFVNVSVGWKTSTWSNILVWDTEQGEFLKRAIESRCCIHVVGPIWFESGSSFLPDLPLTSIAVFDVQPLRDSYYNTLGISFDYYIPSNCIQFLKDIYEAVALNELTLVLKRKRNIGKLIHPSYRILLDEFGEKMNFFTLEPETRADQIIDKSFAVISMPFTSTALVAREMGKPSVYYDPNCMLQKDDTAAHGIEILSGRDELNAWIKSLTGFSN